MGIVSTEELEKALTGSPVIRVEKITASNGPRMVAVILKLKNGKEFSIWGTDGTDEDGTSIISIYS